MIVAIWSGLADPYGWPAGTCTVCVYDAVVNKVLRKHVANTAGEPGWEDILPRELLRSLRGIATAASGVGGSAVEAFLDVLRGQADESLRRPLALTYVCRRPQTRPRRRWILVLPCGALMAWQGSGGKYALVTCFFKDRRATRGKKPRWRRLAIKLVKKYGVFSAEGWVPPAMSHSVVVEEENGGEERRTDIQFITEESWGFRTDLRGRPWRGSLPPWTGAEPDVKRNERPNRHLKRRRPRKEQDDD